MAPDSPTGLENRISTIGFAHAPGAPKLRLL